MNTEEALLNNTPKRIAIWGYGIYGKRTSESMREYWGGAYIVTKIYDYDVEKQGIDPWWMLEVSDPKDIKKDYDAGLFESVMMCIASPVERSIVKNSLESCGIPFLFPGDESSIVPAGTFANCSNGGLIFGQNDYSVFSMKGMMGAVADHCRYEVMYIFNEEGLIPEESVRHFCFDPDARFMLPFRFNHAIPERVKLNGEYCVLARLCSENYWHFTFQNLDCVYLLEKSGYKGKYIICGTESNIILMHELGVGDDRILKCDEFDIHKVYEFEKLLLIAYKGKDLDYSVGVVADIAEKIKSNLILHEDAPKRLYVNRIGKRRLINGEKIAKKHGFEIFVPEEHTVMEQMEAFYNADIVLTPHGANSTNCIYMRKGTVFAEVLSLKWRYCFNQKICEHLGVHYLNVTGVPAEPIFNEWDGINADYYVYEDQIDELIEKAETWRAYECDSFSADKNEIETLIHPCKNETVSGFRKKCKNYQINKVILWGYGNDYKTRKKLFREIHDSGIVQILGITATDLPDLQEIDGWPVINPTNISSIGCDHILVCSMAYYFEIVSYATSTLGINEQMLLPGWILD